MEKAVSTPLGTDNCKGKLTKMRQMECKKKKKNLSEGPNNGKGKEKPTCRGEAEVGEETAKSPRDRQNLQQRYLQQKTEKFHLLSSPDASTELETGKRHRWKRIM